MGRGCFGKYRETKMYPKVNSDFVSAEKIKSAWPLIDEIAF